jgi:DNA repair protein RecN (Recombination protein N)
MLQELRIKNFAIIDEVHLSFSKGFNVITGETGTGKSIILNAVHLLMGDKVGGEMIRSSEEEASVEAIFDISSHPEIQEKIKKKSIRINSSGEEDAYLIRRVVSRSGRGKAFLNEDLVTLGTLSEIGEKLLSISGQHEHQSLLRAETHLDILDEFGELLGIREAFREHFEKYVSLSGEVKKIRDEKERGIKERELLTFQLREIEASCLRLGEEETLKEERKILIHARKLKDFVSLSNELLYEGEGAAVERIQTILRQGGEAATIDPSLSEVIKSLETASIQIEEVAISLRDYIRKIDINPMRLEEVENRLEEIDRLKRKYGPTVEEVLLFKEGIEERLNSFTSNEERLLQMEGRIGSLQGEMIALAKKLSSDRRKVASGLKKSIEKELGSLGMKKTTFEIQMEDSAFSPKGMDRVEFLISPNVGEEVKPLAKIASGGELSRVMLAMKKILARVGGRQVLIFDEVDSGIGGGIAEVVGKTLKELSRHHQVICVTHLPQIACFADTHHSVRKEVKGKRTITVVDRLERDTVDEEIARMLGGVKVTEKTRAHAKEMIENAKKA